MKCECGCGQELTGRKARYASDACKSRAWRQRVGYSIPPASELCQTPVQTPKKRGSGPSGLQVSFNRAVDVLADHLQLLGYSADTGEDRETSRRVLREALSDKQRARLDART